MSMSRGFVVHNDDDTSPPAVWAGGDGSDMSATDVFQLMQSVHPASGVRVVDAFVAQRRGGEYNDVVTGSELYSFLRKHTGRDINLDAVHGLFAHVSHGNSVNMMSLHRFRAEFVAVPDREGGGEGAAATAPVVSDGTDGVEAASANGERSSSDDGRYYDEDGEPVLHTQQDGGAADAAQAAPPSRPARAASLSDTDGAGAGIVGDGTAAPATTRDVWPAEAAEPARASGDAGSDSTHELSRRPTFADTDDEPAPAGEDAGAGAGAGAGRRSKGGRVMVSGTPSFNTTSGPSPNARRGRYSSTGGSRSKPPLPPGPSTGAQASTPRRPLASSALEVDVSDDDDDDALMLQPELRGARTPHALQHKYVNSPIMAREVRHARLEAAVNGDDDGLEEGSDSDGAKYRQRWDQAAQRSRELARVFAHQQLARVVLHRAQDKMNHLELAKAYRKWMLMALGERGKELSRRAAATREENDNLLDNDSELRTRIKQLERALAAAHHKHAQDEAAQRELTEDVQSLKERTGKDELVQEVRGMVLHHTHIHTLCACNPGLSVCTLWCKQAYKERVHDLEKQLQEARSMLHALARHAGKLEATGSHEAEVLDDLEQLVELTKQERQAAVRDADADAQVLRGRIADLERAVEEADREADELRAEVTRLHAAGGGADSPVVAAAASDGSSQPGTPGSRQEDEAGALQRRVRTAEYKVADASRAAKAARTEAANLQRQVRRLLRW